MEKLEIENRKNKIGGKLEKWKNYFKGRVSAVLLGTILGLGSQNLFAEDSKEYVVDGALSKVEYLNGYKEGQYPSGFMKFSGGFLKRSSGLCNYFQVNQDGKTYKLSALHCLKEPQSSIIPTSTEVIRTADKLIIGFKYNITDKKSDYDISYTDGMFSEKYGLEVVSVIKPRIIDEISPIKFENFYDYSIVNYAISPILEIIGCIPHKESKKLECVKIKGPAFKINGEKKQVYLVIEDRDSKKLLTKLGKGFGGLSGAPVLDNVGKLIGVLTASNGKELIIDLIPRKKYANGDVIIDFSRI